MSPVIRKVTDVELEMLAADNGYTIVVLPTDYDDRTSMACKSILNVTFTRKGERVEELVNLKGEDADWRALVIKEFGHRKGFRYTDANNMWDANGKIEFTPPPVARAPLTKAHKKALLEGRKRARALKAELAGETPVVISKPRGRAVTKPKPERNELYNTGHYMVPCEVCGNGILRTGKRGKPPKRHEGCKNA